MKKFKELIVLLLVATIFVGLSPSISEASFKNGSIGGVPVEATSWYDNGIANARTTLKWPAERHESEPIVRIEALYVNNQTNEVVTITNLGTGDTEAVTDAQIIIGHYRPSRASANHTAVHLYQ